MALVLLLLLIKFHPTTAFDWEEVLNLILGLDTIHKFGTFPIFYNQNATPNGFLEGISTESQTPKIVVTKPGRKGYTLEQVINEDSLTIVFADDRHDKILPVVEDLMRGNRMNKIIFVFSETLEDDEIFPTLQYMWQSQFVNSVLLFPNAVGLLQKFIFDPYPKLKMVNKTNSIVADLFPEVHRTDLRGYTINSPLDVLGDEFETRVFLHLNKQKKAFELSGFYSFIFKGFVESMNMKWMPVESVDYTVPGPFDIAFQPNTFQPALVSRMSIGYPVAKVSVCVMIPIRNEIPRFQYILSPFQRNTFIAIFCGLLYISVVLYYSYAYQDIEYGFMDCIQQSLCFVLFLPNWIRDVNPSWVLIVIYVKLFLFGFILFSLYSACLSSYLTTAVYRGDVHTWDELMASDIKILAPAEYIPSFYSNSNIPRDLVNRSVVIAETASQLVNNRRTMNTDYAYMTISDRWDFYNLEQTFLRRPLFRLSNEMCPSSEYVVFPLDYDSHLEEAFKRFVMLAQQHGFYMLWNDVAVREALQDQRIKFLKDMPIVQPMNAEYFQLAWKLLSLGYVVAVLGFALEYFWLRLPKAARRLRWTGKAVTGDANC